ncbi:MAG: FHA domain-containing protein [Pseudomonadota bacterium]
MDQIIQMFQEFEPWQQYAIAGFAAVILITLIGILIILLRPAPQPAPSSLSGVDKSGAQSGKAKSASLGRTTQAKHGERRMRLSWVDQKGTDRRELLTEKQVSRSGGVVIGRQAGEDVDIGLESSSISRRHCQLRVEGGELLLIDLESTNGTSINGTALEPRSPVSVQPGDIIQLAREVTLKLELV